MLTRAKVLVQNAQWLIADGYEAEAKEALHALLEEEDAFVEHRFVFNGKKYTKPNIYELDYEIIKVERKTKLKNIIARLEIIIKEAIASLTNFQTTEASAAIKLQKNSGGGFPMHYDNPGPPNKRGVTAILYLGLGDGSSWQKEDGGTLELRPFCRQGISIAPLCGRLVIFRSDLILHAVSRWCCTKCARFAISFWFDYCPQHEKQIDTVLTRTHLSNFQNWDQAISFFQQSPLQRIISRVIYQEDYHSSLSDCAFDSETLMSMNSAHQATVNSLISKLKPLLEKPELETLRSCTFIPVRNLLKAHLIKKV